MGNIEIRISNYEANAKGWNGWGKTECDFRAIRPGEFVVLTRRFRISDFGFRVFLPAGCSVSVL